MLAASPSHPQILPPRSGLVFVVHGFLRTGASMLPMAAALRMFGFRTQLITQLNLHRDIPDLADGLFAKVMAARDRLERSTGELPDAHFVTHSMGGIVARSMLARHEISGPNRLVMLAPPNHGSRMAAHYRDQVLRQPWGSFDPLRKLLPGELGQCEGAGDPDAEIGVIAGAPSGGAARLHSFPTRPAPGEQPFRPGADGEHDGKVAVDEASWDRAADFLLVPYGHSFIMARRQVIKQTACFLERGHFRR